MIRLIVKWSSGFLRIMTKLLDCFLRIMTKLLPSQKFASWEYLVKTVDLLARNNFIVNMIRRHKWSWITPSQYLNYYSALMENTSTIFNFGNAMCMQQQHLATQIRVRKTASDRGTLIMMRFFLLLLATTFISSWSCAWFHGVVNEVVKYGYKHPNIWNKSKIVKLLIVKLSAQKQSNIIPWAHNFLAVILLRSRFLLSKHPILIYAIISCCRESFTNMKLSVREQLSFRSNEPCSYGAAFTPRIKIDK